jgi:hypothetical protein
MSTCTLERNKVFSPLLTHDFQHIACYPNILVGNNVHHKCLNVLIWSFACVKDGFIEYGALSAPSPPRISAVKDWRRSRESRRIFFYSVYIFKFYRLLLLITNHIKSVYSLVTLSELLYIPRAHLFSTSTRPVIVESRKI